ncbi:MAG: hypothetical protein HYV51_03520 [Parcubacteria group bacterium]|nr:hypothetical protein [Parcubacteria group bacterium]
MESKIPKVFICIRLRPKSSDQSKATAEYMQNLKRARIAARYAVLNGYDPEATTIYFTQFLDDSLAKERELGMKIGQVRLINCDRLWAVLDLDEDETPSSGMSSDMESAIENGIPIEYKDFSKIKTWIENYDKTSK